METIFFITNRCPLSYNSKNRSRYQDILRTDFSNFISQYPSIPLNASLYSKIIYIYINPEEITKFLMSTI